jgi:adenine phosphoribosyltransferase
MEEKEEDESNLVLKNAFKTYHDFPIPGKIFKDICPILRNPQHLQLITNLFEQSLIDVQYTVLIALESRGYIFATGLAL